MVRSLSSLFVAAVFLALFSNYAHAQSGSGIAGVVKDTTGAVLPGVTVEASSPALIERIRTVVTDGAGQFKIVNLSPGVYGVTFTLAGFNTVRREGIALTASFTASVNADLRVGTLEETITVSGEAPTVDVQNVVQQKVITRDLIDQLPAGQKNVYALGALIPGMSVSNQDVGGAAFTSGQLAIHGGRQGETQRLHDGMYYNQGQARGGIFVGISTIDGAVQEMSLETGGLSAESEMRGVRTNIIPRDGGNTFRGSLSGAWTSQKLQSDNLTADLQSQGLVEVPHVYKIWDINPSFGGPVQKDKLWFFASLRDWSSQSTIAANYYSLNPASPIYTPDLSRPAVNIEKNFATSIRLTSQLTPKNKITAQWQPGVKWRPFYGYSMGQLQTTPEATQGSESLPDYLAQAGWNSPVTNRLLLEGGLAYMNLDYVVFPQSDVDPNAPPWKDSGTGITWGNYGGGGSTLIGHNGSYQINSRLSASYVTGSHAAKVGFTFMHASSHVTSDLNPTETTYTVLNGTPRSVTLFALPLTYNEVMGAALGIFGQDQWTVKRLTLNLGARFDYLNNHIPALHIGPGFQVPNRNVDFAAIENVGDWKNISPRLGVSYDVFGNGKTAIKANVGRYLEGPALTSFVRAANPANAIVNTATRVWNDANHDLIPQASELGPLSNTNFGNSIVTTRYADDALTSRGFNWEASASLQHEVASRVSANVSYFRRWYGNVRVNQNTLTSAADYNPYCVPAPTDSRLPNNGGYQVCGLYDVSVAKFGQSQTLITMASNFGDSQEIYNGVDASLNARLPKGIVVSGGTSTGRVSTDTCFVVNSPQALLNCHVAPPFQTQVKILGVYPLPWWGLQTSATFQSIPGPQITASYTATNAQILPTLGRNLSSCGAAATCAGTAAVPLIAPGTMYGDTLNQLDVRASKIFKVAQGRRIQANVDLYNALNASPVLTLNTTYGSAWLRPSTILQGRLVKFSAQVDF